MALNPSIQDKLIEEINSVADENGDVEYDTLVKLPYIDAVLSETLRKYPPAIRNIRVASENYKLGDTGIELFKGQLVLIPVYAMHHDEQFYPDPERFDPTRFLPENRHSIVPYTYLPFGVGPRNCIGMRFALLEAKLGLVKIIQKYKFVPTENTDVPLKLDGLALLIAERVIVGIVKK